MQSCCKLKSGNAFGNKSRTLITVISTAGTEEVHLRWAWQEVTEMFKPWAYRCEQQERWEVIYQPRETVFQRDIKTSRRELKIRCAADEIRGVWIADETLSRVFDISSQ